VCQKGFSDASTAKKHVENIHFPGSYLYFCKFCPESFGKRNLLYMHITKMHKRF
jgi:hypothetical protein